jgi:hypothetical protein
MKIDETKYVFEFDTENDVWGFKELDENEVLCMMD